MYNLFKFLEEKENTITPDYVKYFLKPEEFDGDKEHYDGCFKEVKEMFKHYLQHEIDRGVEEYENYYIWQDKIFKNNPFKHLINNDIGILMMYFIEDGEMVIDNWDDMSHSEILENWDDYYKKFLVLFGKSWFNMFDRDRLY